MSERQTGAKEEQIEAAAERMWKSSSESNRDIPWPYPDDDPYSRIIGRGQDGYRVDAHMWAKALVLPGYVIARESDVVTPELREAIGRVMVFVSAHDRLKDASGSSSKWNSLILEMWQSRNGVIDDDLALLTSVTKGGAS